MDDDRRRKPFHFIQHRQRIDREEHHRKLTTNTGDAIMSDGKRCVWIDKKMRCFDDSPSSAFDESRTMFVKTVDDVRESNPFQMINKCRIQGSECFSRNLKIGAGFFVIYLISGLVMNFFHELVHYILLVMAGISGASFTFAPNLGFTTGAFPPFDASIPWVWWLFETMGPLIIVNFLTVIISLVVIEHDVKNPPYRESTAPQVFTWIKVNFVKAMAFTSAMTILVNTIFSPFYNMYYVLMGMGARTSDLSWAWWVSLQLAEPDGTYMRIAIFFIVSTMITITVAFIFLFNRRETGR